MNAQSRDILIALALKTKGDWNLMYRYVVKPEEIEDEYFLEVEKLKCKVVTMLDPDYPPFLKNVRNAPMVLFYYGDLDIIKDYYKNVSIVGSRDCSSYGITKTHEIASDLAKRGYTIVSGLARGIDSIAHQSAIENGGKTVAILGSGIDYCYPAENIDLYKEIKDNHLLISEIPYDNPPNPSSFPFRNRIIAGMSKTVLITEAAPHSGSLITATLASMLNADVMCVPHEAGKNSECNRLIKNGAFLVESADDVIEQMSNF